MDMSENIIRCGCGAELVTSDPVYRSAVYQCPECLHAEVRRIMDRFAADKKEEAR